MNLRLTWLARAYSSTAVAVTSTKSQTSALVQKKPRMSSRPRLPCHAQELRDGWPQLEGRCLMVASRHHSAVELPQG